jgi:pimeloyl-ACP methyl ester carboxylesterase
VLELEGEAPAIVLLHGYADSADTWRPALAELARRGRRAVAVDMPGFGRADRLESGEVLPQLERFAAAVVRYAGGGDDVVLSGNSLGGCVSLRLASWELPLAGVVPVAPAGLGLAPWITLIERERGLRTLLSFPTPLPERVVREVVGRAYRVLAFARPGAVAREVVNGFTSHHRDRRTVRRYLHTAHRLLPEISQPMKLEGVRVPVLIVWGDRDRMVPHSGAQLIVDAVPDARVEILPDIGHCPQIEATERYIALLLQFPHSLTRAA